MEEAIIAECIILKLFSETTNIKPANIEKYKIVSLASLKLTSPNLKNPIKNCIILYVIIMEIRTKKVFWGIRSFPCCNLIAININSIKNLYQSRVDGVKKLKKMKFQSVKFSTLAANDTFFICWIK